MRAPWGLANLSKVISRVCVAVPPTHYAVPAHPRIPGPWIISFYLHLPGDAKLGIPVYFCRHSPTMGSLLMPAKSHNTGKEFFVDREQSKAYRVSPTFLPAGNIGKKCALSELQHETSALLP